MASDLDWTRLVVISRMSIAALYDASTLIVICGEPLGAFVIADCWLAAENLMLAACALGLGTCCIGLALPSLHAPTVFGYPACVYGFVMYVVIAVVAVLGLRARST